MKNGKIEPKKDSKTLMKIYNKFDVRGYQRAPLTQKEMILLFTLAKVVGEMEADKEADGCCMKGEVSNYGMVR